jgi:hypothetical protein
MESLYLLTVVYRMKVFLSVAAVVALLSNQSFAGWTNVSEVPLYGLSPPIYPTRKHQVS